jgi:phage gpG-like protein
MTMEIDVKTVGFDISPFEAGWELGEEVRARLMGILASKVIEIILSRVQKGVDVDGAPFAPYSPEYFLWKANKGRLTRTIKSGKFKGYKTVAKGVWLSLSGDMLAAIQPLFYDGERFLVGFGADRGDGKSNALIAWVHHEVGGGDKKVKRPFFALSEDEQIEAWQDTLAQAQQEGLI